MLLVSVGFVCAGLYGVLTRRDLVAILASIEVMVGGALLLLAGLGAAWMPRAAEAVTLLFIVLAAAEAACGLALVVVVARRARTTRVDELTEVNG